MPSNRTTALRPTPHGVGGLKSFGSVESKNMVCPTPHGVGGLKYLMMTGGISRETSHPTRGGWIEIDILFLKEQEIAVPPHTGWVD